MKACGGRVSGGDGGADIEHHTTLRIHYYAAILRNLNDCKDFSN